MSRGIALVIDDDQDQASSIAGLLAAMGLSTRSATTAASAQASVRAEPPLIILCDLHLGPKAGTTGVALIASLRSEHPTIRLIAISGYTGFALLLAAARRMGADGHIAKPVTRAALEEVIGDLIAKPSPG
jgi:CheY-like chemotaxis protein